MKVRTLKTGRLRREVWPGALILVSDLHENSGGGHDDFQKDRFLDFIGWCARRYPKSTREFLILGDRYERLEEPRGAKIAQNNWTVDRTLAVEVVVEVPGNHDDVDGIDSSFTISEWSDFFAWHGHQLDPACSGRVRFDWAGSLLWGGLQKIGLGPRLEGVRDYLTRWVRSRQKTAAQRGDDNYVYKADALRRVEDDSKVLVASGHTHCPELTSIEGHPGCFYANPGCWVDPRASHAIVIEGTEISLLEVTDG